LINDKLKDVRMNNKILFGMGILFLSVILLSPFVDTVLLCEVTQSCSYTDIFHISNQTNAHAELNNNSNYTYKICCSDTSGLNIGTNCSGEYFTLLHLSNQTNAHAELNNELNYNFNVCISSTDGLFNCSYESSCSNYNTCIASISSSTNAHIGECADYATKICCNTTAANTAPTIIANATSPTKVYTNTDFKLNLTVTDPDYGDIITTYTQFYVNGTSTDAINSLVVNNGTNTNVANLPNSNFNKGSTLIAEFWAGDGKVNTTKYNTTEVIVLNSPPSKVNLLYPENDDQFFTNRTPKFNWTAATDADNDQLTYQIQVSLNSDVSSPLTNETGVSDEYYIQPSELNFATYYWKVRANDGEEYGNWSDVWNFTLIPFVSIILTQDAMNFGMMEQFESNDTTNNQPNPFIIENNGNIEANISVNSTSLWKSKSALLNTSYFQFKTGNSIETNSFDWVNSQTAWSNMSNIYKSIINTLNHTNSNDVAEIDIRVEVVSDEPAGSKSASLTFYAEES